MKKIKGAKGILFIGDPHLWSKSPSRRLDSHFATTVLDKLEQSIDIANSENLVPVILGDLFHSDEESDIEMLTKLIRVLSKSKHKCASVEGNHEKKQTKLHDGSALSLLRDAKIIDVYESNGFASLLDIDGFKVLVGSTPYGGKIPTEISAPKNENVDYVIWLTHANLDFGDTYPGVQKIHEIKGVNMLVNGHIHKTRPSIKVGNMIAYNPGNITRLSVDCIDHKPNVWKWVPERKDLITPITLKFNPEIFDVNQHMLNYEAKAPEEIESVTPAHVSQFVHHMQKQVLDGVDLSDDGGYLKESINALAKAMELDDEIKNDIHSLVEEVLKNDIEIK